MVYSWPVLHPVTASFEFARILVGVDVTVEVGKAAEPALTVGVAVTFDGVPEAECSRVPRTAPSTMTMMTRSTTVRMIKSLRPLPLIHDPLLIGEGSGLVSLESDAGFSWIC